MATKTAPETETAAAPTPTYSPAYTPKASLILTLALSDIHPSPLNPRKVFAPDALEELAASIRSHGLLEPLVVRSIAADPKAGLVGPYELIAGERRWRACQLVAGLTDVPARVLTEISDRTALEMMLIENLQRQDLDPLEEAAAYKALQDVGLTQAQIAAAVKRSQPAVAKTMGLMRLPEDVQALIREGKLTATHGVVLARFADFPAVVSQMAKTAVSRGATSKALADAQIPFTYELETAGLIRSVRSYEAHFDMRICRSACPFGAYVGGSHDDFGYCLKPDHYQQLRKEADDAERKRVLDAQKARKALAPGEKAETAPALPKLADLKNAESFQYTGGPRSCTELCPCSAHALSRDGTVVRVCTDPKRLASLKTQQSRAENAAKRQTERDQRTKLTDRLENITAVDVHELALITAHLVGSFSSRKETRAAAESIVPGLAEAMQSYETFTHAIPLLACQDPVTLVRLAVTVMLLGDLAQEYSSHKETTWYLTSGTLPASTLEAATARVMDDWSARQAPAESVQRLPQPALDAVVDPQAQTLRTRLDKLQERHNHSRDAGERAVLRAEIATLQAKGGE